MSEHDGGPAFPLDAAMHGMSRDARADVCGMTLRDYFAAKAMQAYLSRPHSERPDLIWQASYMMADAILKERDR